MCIICIKPKGQPMPTDETIKTMFSNNPHGAGYMVAKNGNVIIHKGFMNVESFLSAIHREHIRKDQTAVLHFRISTQGGINPELTHPFPLSNSEEHLTALDLSCPCGVAHNGIIQLTTDRAAKLSDTQLFIRDYLSALVTSPADLKDSDLMDFVEDLIQSKMVLLDGSGEFVKLGRFTEANGIFYSNDSFRPHEVRRSPAFISFMERHGNFQFSM